MKRRSLLAAGMAGLVLPAVAPSIARAQKQTTLKFIPQIDLSFLDPHWTTAFVTRNHGYLVFDTLYGIDGSYKASPQMVEGHTVENDGRLWKLTLRPGLLWHDNQPVLARDCVASIKRWARRDAFGDALMLATDELSAPDDRTVQFRLKRPFPLLPDALGKSSAPMCAMMPERLADTDAFKQITDIVGSGPYRYKTDERVSGAFNAYERFAGYRPREGGTPDWTSGPKITHFDRIEWRTTPEPASAAAALQNGEVDWWEYATHDLLPLLNKNKNVRVAVQDPTGGVEMLRANCLQKPFNNPRIRQIVMSAINQADYMQAIVGENPAMYYAARLFLSQDADGERRRPGGVRPQEGLREDQAGPEGRGLRRREDGADGRRRLPDPEGAGRRGRGHDDQDRHERRLRGDRLGHHAAAPLQEGPGGAGRLEHVRHRLGRHRPPEPGRAHRIARQRRRRRRLARLVRQSAAGSVAHRLVRGAGPGRPAKICADMQRQALIDVPYMPVGQYIQPTALRADLSGMLNGFATFWNIRRG
jgi:peptide/nickel transport system substrate-binding protein